MFIRLALDDRRELRRNLPEKMIPIAASSHSRRPRLVYILTVARTGPLFLGGFVKDLCASGFDVSFVSSPGPGFESITAEGASTYGVEMKREITPVYDLLSLWRLWMLLRKIRPDITNVGTPKAGFLGGLAAVLAGVPYRIYTMHCLRLETTKGWKRRVLWCAEWLSCRCAHHVYCVSPSLREQVIGLNLVDKAKTSVAANGTCNGIDSDRFAPTQERVGEALCLRAKLGIDPGAMVVGFVGRLTRDKGIPELYEAFSLLRARFPDLRLLLVGDYESGDAVPNNIRARLDADPTVVRIGWVADPAPYYRVMDVLAMPSHREGIGLVSLEAQASRVPVVTTSATGARDSVVSGITGLCAPVGDAAALADAIARLLQDSSLRGQMGDAARDWVVRMFDRRVLWSELKERYVQVAHPGTVNLEHR
jgi:glycosyltransferase involved in cell wall biosynthesis